MVRICYLMKKRGSLADVFFFLFLLCGITYFPVLYIYIYLYM